MDHFDYFEPFPTKNVFCDIFFFVKFFWIIFYAFGCLRMVLDAFWRFWMLWKFFLKLLDVFEPVCDQYYFQAQVQIRIYIRVNISWQIQKLIYSGCNFWQKKYKYILIQYFRRIQIYLGLPKMGKCECIYNNLDWYLQIQT